MFDELVLPLLRRTVDETDKLECLAGIALLTEGLAIRLKNKKTYLTREAL